MRLGRGARIAGGLLLVIVALGATAWLFRDALPFSWNREVPEPTEISPEAAAVASEKLRRLQTEGDTVRLSEIELASLLRYRTPLWAAGMLNEPSVDFAGDTVRLSGMVPTDRLPSHPQINSVRAFLPDSSRVDLRGVLLARGERRIAVDVAELSFAGIPIPSRYYPAMLTQLGRKDEPGLPVTALSLPLPLGVGSVRIVDGYLVLAP